MKSFVVLSVLLVGLASAVPQGYGGGGQQQVRKCRTIKTVEYDEKYETICKQIYENVCQTLYDNICTPYQEEHCENYQRRECEDRPEKSCRQTYDVVKQPYNEEECNYEWVNKCKGVWEVAKGGDKVWVEDKNDCDDYQETVCKQVQKYRDHKVPRQECSTVYKEHCYNVPDRKCNYVTKERCQRKARQSCKKEPKQDCHDEHIKVPRQVVKQVCPGQAGYDDVHDGGFVDPAAVIISTKDVSDDDVDIRSGDAEKDDKITFGR